MVLDIWRQTASAAAVGYIRLLAAATFYGETMPKFRSKPCECEAWQWNGDPNAMPEGSVHYEPVELPACEEGRWYVISVNGRVYLDFGDWVIAEPTDPGRYYPCKDLVFRNRWEAVAD